MHPPSLLLLLLPAGIADAAAFDCSILAATADCDGKLRTATAPTPAAVTFRAIIAIIAICCCRVRVPCFPPGQLLVAFSFSYSKICTQNLQRKKLKRAGGGEGGDANVCD
jgi:hypothetical protein